LTVRVAALYDIHVRGNGDREVAGEPPEGAFPDRARWCASRLSASQLDRVRQWPLTAALEIDGLGCVLFCHAVPASDLPIVTTLTPDADVARAIGPVDADVVVCGHVHVQYERKLPSGPRVVNARSVGAPYEGRAAAFWLLLGPDVEHVASEYGVGAAVARLEATGCPDTDGLVRVLLEPVGAVDAMAEFESLLGP
jgi:diadenosine tetraphosphatase ApaH/serine/threonine PP2A family protein phosphatase